MALADDMDYRILVRPQQWAPDTSWLKENETKRVKTCKKSRLSGTKLKRNLKHGPQNSKRLGRRLTQFSTKLVLVPALMQLVVARISAASSCPV